MVFILIRFWHEAQS